MQLAVTAAVADAAPGNLVHFVIDNGTYAVSGAQPTPAPADWERLLLGAGYAAATTCTTADELRAAAVDRAEGPRAVIVRCARERPAYPAGFLDFSAAGEAARLRRVLAAHPSRPTGGDP
jgi:hypothetical protein